MKDAAASLRHFPAQAARRLMEQGMPPSAAAKQAAQGTAFSKSQVYRLLIKEDAE